MKKRIIVISFFILFILGLLIIINNKDNKIYTDIDGIKYAILVNGESSTSFPNGNYKVEVDCTNADAYWDNIAHKIIVKNITGDVSCDIEFNSITSSDYLNSYIINLCNGTSNMGICDATTASNQGSGQLVNENGLRYEGSNPNNYLFFNDELWRIIGVFSTAYDSDNDGTADSTDDLVKIIREESIGGLVWDKYNSNKWPNSSLYHLLNEQYYDWETNKTNVSNHCYGYSTTIPTTCDYSINGIKNGYREMIQKVQWYLGGGGKYGYTDYKPDNVYSYERDQNAVYSSQFPLTSVNYIGLMYESDYLYGVLASDCARTKNHSSYNTANCAGKDWVFSDSSEFTITSNWSGTNTIWFFGNNGNIAITLANVSSFVRPTLYLSPNVYRVSGTGTITDPYIIGMATS